ncbi:hypothetical protein [Marinobacter alexandrii]|uniref:hypothetical protein n=1 Tax=Marinobacter alexandrii TaxID=2570351 RepID=UPI002ABE57A7|nr:hypothetical protein [Marinobacter alexandrii]
MKGQRLFSAEGLESARLLRLAVSFSLLALLVWFLLGVLEREARKAEEQSANLILNQLRASLVIKGAEVMLSRNGRLEEYQGINPFELVSHQWPSYTGLCKGPQYEPGTWCFLQEEQKVTAKTDRGWLIYTANQPITLNGRGAQASESLAWKVTTEYADRNKNGQREQSERSTGLKLSPVSSAEQSVLMQDARH